MSTSIALAASTPTIPPMWRLLTKFGYFTGLAGAIGFTVTYAVAVGPALRKRASAGTSGVALMSSESTRVRRRSSHMLAGAGLILLVSGYFQLAGRATKPGQPFGPSLHPSALWHFIQTAAKPGAWIASGTIFGIQSALIAIVGITMIALLIPAARARLDRAVSGLALASIVITLMPSVPANVAMETLDDALESVLIQTHIVGGCVWVGGLALLAVLARRHAGRDDGDGRAGLIWAQVWSRFSTLALVAVGMVLISGLWLSWKEVGNVSQLFTTTFGRFLLVKVILVLLLLGVGGYNQLSLLPRIARLRATAELGEKDDAGPPNDNGASRSLLRLTLRHFPVVVAIETALGVGVLAIVPFLTGSARAQAGDTSGQPSVDGGVLVIGLIMIATVVLSFVATSRVSDRLARRSELPEPSRQDELV